VLISILNKSVRTCSTFSHSYSIEGQHGFRPGYSCESQVIAVCQDIADSLDNGYRIDAIIIDFS